MARFVKLTPDVSVQYWLEFIGSNAVLMKDSEWPEKHYVPRDPNRKNTAGIILDETARFYLQAREVQNGLSFEPFATELFDFAKLQFHRENGARIVHYRPSDEKPFLGGFGRPNPYNGRNCHNDFSEPFVDRRPGTTFMKYRDGAPVGEEVWHGFEPVYLKVKPARKEVSDAMFDTYDAGDSKKVVELAKISDEHGSEALVDVPEYYLKVWTEWCDSEIFVLSETNSADVPQELRDYEFQSHPTRPDIDPDEFERGAEKFHHRPRIRNR